MYRNANGISRDRKKAASLFSRACDAGVARSCVLLAEQHFVGWGVTQDPVQGRKLLELACSKSDAMACGALSTPLATAGGTTPDTVRAWKELTAAPAPLAVFDDAQTNQDFLERLSRLRRAYQGINTNNADPELARYVADWLTWTDDASRYFDDQERRRKMAGDLAFITVLARVATEKNEQGERDVASMQRGMEKGRRDSRMLTRNPNEDRDANALGERARALAAHQDPLALRLEMAHGVYLPPPAAKSEK